jgi:hypothetical protein
VDELILQIPAEFEIDFLPRDVRLDEPFGLFESIYKVEEDKIIHKRIFVRKKLFVPVDRYDQLKDFYDRVAEEDNQRIILKKKSGTDEINE